MKIKFRARFKLTTVKPINPWRRLPNMERIAKAEASVRNNARNANRYIGAWQKMFLGPTLCPLSRKKFAKQAMKVLLVRMPLGLAITYPIAYALEKIPLSDLSAWGLVIIGILASLFFLLPYFRLMHWRVAGSAFQFPKTVVCVTALVLFAFPPVADGVLEQWPAIEIACYFGLYLALYALPDGARKTNASH